MMMMLMNACISKTLIGCTLLCAGQLAMSGHVCHSDYQIPYLVIHEFRQEILWGRSDGYASTWRLHTTVGVAVMVDVETAHHRRGRDDDERGACTPP